ncbi:MAG: response regulator transcription factor [Bacillota bacterium]
MFKVLIVDDEAVIRKGLKNIIDWKSLECDVCGEASDGVEGQAKIKALQPDIIITDINMPEVDGLNMIKETKALIPYSKIIILTGFRDFEYMQEAIRLGAYDYILKPSKIEDITSVISKAVKELKQKIKIEEELQNLKQSFQSKIPILKQKLLYDIIFTSHLRNEDMLEELELYGMKVDDFYIVAVETEKENKPANKTHYEKQLYQFGVINTFEDIMSEHFDITYVPINNHVIVFLLQPKQANIEDMLNLIYKQCSSLQELIYSCFDFSITITISSAGKGPFDIEEKAHEALDALYYKSYMGSSPIILYDDLKAFYKPTDISGVQNIENQLIKSIKSGNIHIVKDILSEYFDSAGEIASIENQGGLEKVFALYNNLINTLSSLTLTETRKEIYGIDYNASSLLDGCKTVEEANGVIEAIVLHAADKIKSYNQKSINATLQRALEYISNNYQNSVTLNEVAEQVFISPYYLSRMFSKELGKNFVDCLNEVRIEKAKEYLKNSFYKAYEIAELVGINDAHYFSKLFKKYTGVTPSEYKNI